MLSFEPLIDCKTKARLSVTLSASRARTCRVDDERRLLKEILYAIALVCCILC